MLPIVGITVTPIVVAERPHDAPNRAFVDAVAGGGGLPVLLPILDPARADDALAAVDALVLSGGGDIDPARYGHPPDERADGVDASRDAWELALAAAARERGMPVLGICRGAQVVNVACGGTLVVDLAGVTDAMHRDAERFAEVVHPVTVTPGSLAARVLGCTELGVNTLHHQAVDRVGEGLVVVGTAEDGMVEAIEADDGAPVLGVQWHPELLVAHEAHHRLFEWIAAEGAARRDGGGRARMVA
jgi:putative glutamine amidotransferase